GQAPRLVLFPGGPVQEAGHRHPAKRQSPRALFLLVIHSVGYSIQRGVRLTKDQAQYGKLGSSKGSGGRRAMEPCSGQFAESPRLPLTKSPATMYLAYFFSCIRSSRGSKWRLRLSGAIHLLSSRQEDASCRS